MLETETTKGKKKQRTKLTSVVDVSLQSGGHALLVAVAETKILLKTRTRATTPGASAKRLFCAAVCALYLCSRNTQGEYLAQFTRGSVTLADRRGDNEHSLLLLRDKFTFCE